MRIRVTFLGLFLLIALSAQAQTFVSGSTGADGALDLTAGDRTVQLPASGILNYTTVNIPVGRILSFKRNLNNTPVVLLVQGNVTIAGRIDVTAGEYVTVPGGTVFDGRPGGPGGFFGGGSYQPGFGPGGGQPPAGAGKWVGPLSLVPIIGGSGGCCGGAGGGGAIVIASSTSIELPGSINAYGTCNFNNQCGAGGAIRLVANIVNVGGTFFAHGGNLGAGVGVVRLEAPLGALTFTGSSIPPAILSTINPTITPINSTSLSIVSIGGYAVPPYSGTRFNTVDLLLPNSLTDPINVLVQASNIPVGTQVNITFSGSQQATSTSGILAGTLTSSTAVPTISGLGRTEVTYLFVSTIFDLPASAGMLNPPGPDQIAKVQMEAAPASKPRLVFLRSDGTVIDQSKVPPPLLWYYGQ